MRRLRLSGLVLLAALTLCLPPKAWAAATGWVGDDHAAARLVTATDAVGSEAAVEAGLEIRLCTGLARLLAQAPATPASRRASIGPAQPTSSAADIAWPAPARYSLQGFETAGYRDHVVLPIALTLTRPGQPLDLHALVNWAACANICVPYSTQARTAAAGRPGGALGGGGADRRRARPGPATARRGRDRSRRCERHRPRRGHGARGAAAQPGHGIRSARSVRRGARQGFARPARGGAVAIRAYRAAERADPRRGRRRPHRQETDPDSGRRGPRRRVHRDAAPRIARRRPLAAVADPRGRLARRAGAERDAVRAAGAVAEIAVGGEPGRGRAAAGAARATDDGARRPRVVCAARRGVDRVEGIRRRDRLGHPVPVAVVHRRDGRGDDTVRSEPVGLAADLVAALCLRRRPTSAPRRPMPTRF